MFFLDKKLTDKTPHAIINRAPPIGVTNPKGRKSINATLEMANKYNDPLNKKTPAIVK
jgi:hypothetical protein